MPHLPALILVSTLVFASSYMLVRYGWPALRLALRRRERWLDRVLNQQLLMAIPARTALNASLVLIVVLAALGYVLIGGVIWASVGGVLGFILPTLIVRHLEQKRRQRMEEQLVDGITTLASGVRAGLNLIQAMELLAANLKGPIQQEFAQLLREYQMGLDLNQAMRNAADRIGSPHYRLLFTAIEMHRKRGGSAGESLDRIAESIREIQRLEGKLDALTSQGRTQAWMMATFPIIFLLMLYAIEPKEVSLLITEPAGRMILLAIVALILTAFFWIRRIMTIDI